MITLNNNRIHTIDLIRGLCILAVILLHINIRLHFDTTSLGETLSPTFLKTMFWSGSYGVIIFFVVSGFLITTTSIQRWGSLSALKKRSFYWIRFSRIMPSLLGVVVISCILDVAHVKGYVISTQKISLFNAAFSALTFHLNWLEAKIGYLPGAWDVLWSLSVEELFYFCFLIMLALIIIGPFARTVLTHNDIWQDKSYLSCMDGIAFGCLAAIIASKQHLNPLRLKYYFSLGLLLTIFILIFRKTVAHLDLTITGLNVTVLEMGIALLLIPLYNHHLKGSSQPKNYTRFIAWFGQNSYEIYLTHMFVVITFTTLFIGWHGSVMMMPLWYLSIVGLSGILGFIVARYYSIPLNHFLRSHEPFKYQ
jgi:peptidoglycan/LPS O-acetylase OafA/YrhL